MFSISKIKGYQREGATDVLALKYCTCLYSPPPVTLKYEKAKPMGKILPGKATSVKYVIGILHKKKSGVLCHEPLILRMIFITEKAKLTI